MRSSLLLAVGASLASAQICYQDNCLREMQDPRFSSMASTFCPTYTTSVLTAPSDIPSYLENCYSDPVAVSSACTCLLAATTTSSAPATTATVVTPIPTTLIIYVIQASNGATLGTLTGAGNFSSPGPAYPFRAYPTTGGYSRLSAYATCTVDGILDCGTSIGTVGQFYKASSGYMAIQGAVSGFSVDALTDAAGGFTPVGRPYGIPVHIGSSSGAIPVVLSPRAAQG